MYADHNSSDNRIFSVYVLKSYFSFPFSATFLSPHIPTLSDCTSSTIYFNTGLVTSEHNRIYQKQQGTTPLCKSH